MSEDTVNPPDPSIGAVPPPPPPPPTPAAFGRLTKHILLGAVFGGVLSSIPLLNCLNLCFCLMNIAGITLAMMMYFKSHPGDTLTGTEAALFGVIAGAGAGLIRGVFDLLIGAAVMGMIAGFMQDVNPQIAHRMALQTGLGILAIPLSVVLFAGFGALGGFLSMQLFFKKQLRP